MRWNTALLLLAALTGVCAAPARAADAPDGASFNIMGSSSCARWPKRGAIESAGKAVPLNWVLGYMSGQAMRGEARLLPLIDPDKVAAALESYCKDHPEASVPSAARAITAQFEAELPPPPPPMFLPPEALRLQPAKPVPAPVPAAEAPAAPAKAAPAKKAPAPRKRPPLKGLRPAAR